ncbi:MAG: hypothetical protein ACTSV2_15070 [Candidatus Thorarchaeota archaeon]
MFFSKKCPKCDSIEIAGPHDLGTGTASGLTIRLPGLFSSATLICYVCSECGYTEFYANKYGRKSIRKDGRYTLNPRPSRLKHCPRCNTRTKKDHTTCHRCGSDIMKT